MKFFGNKKTSQNLSETLETLGSLAKIPDQEATDEIKRLLTENQKLDPYASIPGQNSPFSIALANGNIESLYAMYLHKPDPKYKPLLDSLVVEKLEEEAQNSSPSLEKVQALLKIKDPSYLPPNEKESSQFQELFDSENIISLHEAYQIQPNPAYKYLLDRLASKKLLEEMQKASPSIENIKFLLEAGADPTKENDDKQSALTLANANNKLELLHIMGSYVSSNKATNYIQDATQQALFKEVIKEKPDHDNIRFLIEKGADPFLKLPDTREANKILEEKVKGKNPNREAKEVSAFDVLAENPHNLKSLHLMYRKLPKKLEKDRTSYSKTLTDLVKNRLQQNLIKQKLNKETAENSFTRFNQMVAAAEKSKLPEISEYASELMAPHFNEAFKKESTYDAEHYYQDNPGVLSFEQLSEKLGKHKATSLQKSSSIKIASAKEYRKYMLSKAKEIINEYAETSAENKYNFLKKQNPNLNDQELLDKFVPKEMQQDIFHLKHPNKILEETVTELIGSENLEQFKLATKIEILTELQITKAIEQQNDALHVPKVEAFLDRAPLLTNASYDSHSPKLINFAFNHVHSNPQLLRKTITLIQEQNKDNPSAIENMAKRIVNHGNNLESPASALQLHSVLMETGVPLPNNYKLGQLSKEELEELQTLTKLTKDREKFLKGNCSAEEMKQLHDTVSKLPLKKLPTNISEDIISLIDKSTKYYFDKEVNTSQNIVETIEDMVKISKNSTLMLGIYATETPEILRNHLTHIAVQNIIPRKVESPTKLHKQKMADHKKEYDTERNKLNDRIARIEEEIKILPTAMQLSNAANLMTIDVSKITSKDQMELYSEERQRAIDKKQAELSNARANLDRLTDNFHKKKLNLEEQLEGKKLAKEQKLYDKKLEEFHQFLLKKPNLKDTTPENDSLSSHVLEVAIENIDIEPRIMDQVVVLFKEQYSKEDLIIGLNDYRDQLLQDSHYKDQPEELKNYFKQLTDSIEENYVVNSPDGNVLVMETLAKLDQYPELTEQLKQDLITPSFPQISDAIRKKLLSEDITSEQAELLTEVLVEQLNESPPLNIGVLQKLHEEEKELTKKLSDKLPPKIKKLQEELKEKQKETENIFSNAHQNDVSQTTSVIDDALKKIDKEKRALIEEIEKLSDKLPEIKELQEELKAKQNEVQKILRNARPYDVSQAISAANDDLAKYIYLSAPQYKAINHEESTKLVEIALKDSNDKILHRIINDIRSKARTTPNQEEILYNDLLSVQLLHSLHKAGKLDQLFTTKNKSILNNLKEQVINTIIDSKKRDIDPNLICDVIKNTQGADNDKLSEIANIVLSDKKKIEKLSKENIEILAPYYNSSRHNPLFLKELIDIHDTTFEPDSLKRIFSKGKKVTTSDLRNVGNAVRLSLTGTNTTATELPEDFNKNIEKYLKTKRSVFKAFFRDQEAKITKRIGELDRGSNYFKTIMTEWKSDPEQKKTMRERFMSIFGLSKEKEKTLTLNDINTLEKMKKVLEDSTAQEHIRPDLATAIFHKAMQLEMHSDNRVRENIRQLAEIAYNNRETGSSPHLTNDYINKLFEQYPSDEFYKQAKAELQTAAANAPTEKAQEEVKKSGMIDRMKKTYQNYSQRSATRGIMKRQNARNSQRTN